jgi:tRNA 2-thiouridine synthesizing protein A
MAAIMPSNCMERTLDARGLSCPLPLVKARAALAELGPADVLVVLATDPEAPIDLAALAADHGRAFGSGREGGHWRLVLSPSPAPPHAHGGAGRPAAT